jgi:hypothetical protein
MKPLTAKIIKAGLIVGTLDILSAFIHVCIKTGSPHIPDILKFIASGIFGKDASSGGIGMVLAGLVFHYVIAFTWTIFFFWLYPKIKAASKNRIWTGIVYGIFVWVVMNLVVVPLSNIPHRDFNIWNALINTIILMVCVGLPLSFMASVHFKHTKNTA